MQLIPGNWKRALVRLRGDIQHALTRWAHKVQDDAQRVPVRWGDPWIGCATRAHTLKLLSQQHRHI